MHARAIGIKDTSHFDADPMLPVVIEEKGFCTPFPLIVTCPETDGVDTPPIGLRLGMDRRIPVDLRSGCLKDLGPQPLRQAQHIDGTMNVHLGRLNGVVLIVDRSSGTSQVVDFVNLHIEREGDVVANKFKIRISQQMDDIPLGPRIEIVDTEDIVSILEETLAEMGTQESSPSCD